MSLDRVGLGIVEPMANTASEYCYAIAYSIEKCCSFLQCSLDVNSSVFTTWRDILLTLSRAFGKRFRPSVANVEGIWETIWT